MLNDYLQNKGNFKVRLEFSYDEVVHFFLPRPKVIYSYVVEDPKSKEITDFISFYSLPSSVMGNEKHDKLRVSYSVSNRLRLPTPTTTSLRLTPFSNFSRTLSSLLNKKISMCSTPLI